MTNRKCSLFAALALCLGLLLAACGGDNESEGEHGGEESSGEHGGGESSGEHGGEESSGEHSGGTESAEDDEESGTRYAKDESFDESRRGARLVLRYDPDQDAFVGTVTNTTDAVLDRVRVEVHLSNGVELGPTTPGDLQPGESAQITLPADGEQFGAWSAHPESGSDEHGTEGNAEHGTEEDAEHDESSN
ncbi:FxLYD domain-containing protein [Candidatus Poriferisodalis sp.]|uniref:FxLYD domain-containing protein n=1 Tax=Candidatus Poriferisodalis sp. TaxID=3101277 RepID=UPI003C6EB840